jgi:hypothetical protein
MNGQSAPFKIGWHSSVDLDKPDSTKLILYDFVKSFARALRSTGLGVEIKAFRKAHRCHANVNDLALKRKSIYSDFLRQCSIDGNITRL